MTIEVYADELLRLTVEDLGDEILVDIKDPENQTDEHLAHLRKLVDQRAEKDKSRPVNAGELGDRLGQLRSRHSTPSSFKSLSSTPSYDEEEEREDGWLWEQESYKALVEEGGRPSHPIHLGFDVIDNPEKYPQYQDILWFWHYHGSTIFRHEFLSQLREWRSFRGYQDRMRKYYLERNKFGEYQSRVRESQSDQGCAFQLRVLEDWHQQDRLEDWNEFRARFYRRLKAQQRRVEPAEKELLRRQENWEEARAQLGYVGGGQVLSGRSDDTVTAKRELSEANSRLESAEKGLEAAKRNMSLTKAGLIETAQQELCSAQANLKQLSRSEETRNLEDISQMELAEMAMMRAKARLGRVRLEIKRWWVIMSWIDDQFAAVAAQCGYPTQDDVEDEPVEYLEEEDGPTNEELPRQRRRKQIRSLLGLDSPSRITKPPGGNSDGRPQLACPNPPLDMTTTQQHPAASQKLPRPSARVRQSRADQVARVSEISALGAVSASRVTKSRVSKSKASKSKATFHATRQRSPRATGTRWNTSCGNANNLRRSQRIMTRNEKMKR